MKSRSWERFVSWLCSVLEGTGSAVSFVQLLERRWVFLRDMKTFLKVLLLVVVALVAIKLLPLTIGLGFVAGLLLVGLMAAGLSLLAGIAVLAVVLGAVLAPIWIPVLLIVGLVALIRRATRKRVAA